MLSNTEAPFPPPPVSTIDWSNIGFKVREVNGHVLSTYSHSSGTQKWSPPRFVASPHIPLHGMAPGLNYGQQAYEGLKAFRHADGKIAIFRPDRNARRMQRSATFISIPPVPEDHFLECVKLAVAANAEYVPPYETGAAMYIRPLVFGSSAQLGLNPPDEYTFVVFVMPTGVYHGAHAIDGVILEDFDRAAPEGTGSVKVGGNYAPVLRHSEKARQEGYGITLHLDSKTRSEVDEFSTSAFIGVHKPKDGKGVTTLVVPNSKNVIDSVTASSIMDVAEKIFGYQVEKRRIPYEEIATFNEVMAAGTAAALVPIRSITMKSTGDKFTFASGSSGQEDNGGEVCVQLLTTLQAIQRGKQQDKFGWCFEVERPPRGLLPGDAHQNNGSVTNVP